MKPTNDETERFLLCLEKLKKEVGEFTLDREKIPNEFILLLLEEVLNRPKARQEIKNYIQNATDQRGKIPTWLKKYLLFRSKIERSVTQEVQK